MFEKLADFNGRIDRSTLRVRRPRHSIFLCGGVISPDQNSKPALSVRDYLVRIRGFQSRLTGTLILAETAQQLYRDTQYSDLISFEEDVARISSIVLVISESAGSLAELGAFASEAVIRDALRIIISEDHEASESFVRFGPVRRVERIDRERLGVFPWKIRPRSGTLIKSSIAPHYGSILAFINDCVNKIPKSHLYSSIPEKSIFYDILWILSLLEVVSPNPLYNAVRIIHPTMQDGDIRDKLFVMKTAGWVNSFSYSNKDYYFLPVNLDPYEYSFFKDKKVRDVAAEKLIISEHYRKHAIISKQVMKRLQEFRGGQK